MKLLRLSNVLISCLFVMACQSARPTTERGLPASVVRAGPVRPAANPTTLQREVLTYLNQARSRSCRCGSTTYPPVPPLSLSEELNTASQRYADDMAQTGVFSHTGRDRSRPQDRVTRAGYVWQAVGENIAAGTATVRSTVDGWLKSPGHCANIMNPQFREVGVGYSRAAGGRYHHYWVTDFGTRRSR